MYGKTSMSPPSADLAAKQMECRTARCSFPRQEGARTKVGQSTRPQLLSPRTVPAVLARVVQPSQPQLHSQVPRRWTARDMQPTPTLGANAQAGVVQRLQPQPFPDGPVAMTQARVAQPTQPQRSSSIAVALAPARLVQPTQPQPVASIPVPPPKVIQPTWPSRRSAPGNLTKATDPIRRTLQSLRRSESMAPAVDRQAIGRAEDWHLIGGSPQPAIGRCRSDSILPDLLGIAWSPGEVQQHKQAKLQKESEELHQEQRSDSFREVNDMKLESMSDSWLNCDSALDGSQQDSNLKTTEVSTNPTSTELAAATASACSGATQSPPLTPNTQATAGTTEGTSVIWWGAPPRSSKVASQEDTVRDQTAMEIGEPAEQRVQVVPTERVVMCKVRKLRDWLLEMNLLEYHAAAAKWCLEMGAANLEEIAENIGHFGRALHLKPIERQRVGKWAAEFTGGYVPALCAALESLYTDHELGRHGGGKAADACARPRPASHAASQPLPAD